MTPLAAEYELAILHTSTPSFAFDVKVAEALKAENPKLIVGFVGAHVAISAETSLRASQAIDFVARNEFDFTIKEVAEGRPLADIDGISYKTSERIVHNGDRAILHDMDRLPFVTDVYKRDLVIEDYFIGYLRHPYLSIARELGKRGITWSCNAKANVPYETLRVLRDNGLRLFVVGYETGNRQILINIKKGVRLDRAREFTADC